MRREHRLPTMFNHLSILGMKGLKALAATFSQAQLLSISRCILTDGKDHIRVILKKCPTIMVRLKIISFFVLNSFFNRGMYTTRISKIQAL